MHLFVNNREKAGYLEISPKGYLRIADDFSNATALRIDEWKGESYFVVDSGEWKGWYVGYEAAGQPWLCAVKDFNFCTYVRFEAAGGVKADVFAQGELKLISKSFDQREWRLKENEDGVWIGTNADGSTYFRQTEGTGELPSERYYWMFLKKYGADETITMSFRKHTSNKQVSETDFETVHKLSVSSKVPFSELVEADVSLESGVEYKEHRSKEEIVTTDLEVVRECKVTAGQAGWALVRRTSYEKANLVFETFVETCFVDQGAPPHIDRSELVMLRRGGELITWEVAKLRMLED